MYLVSFQDYMVCYLIIWKYYAVLITHFRFLFPLLSYILHQRG